VDRICLQEGKLYEAVRENQRLTAQAAKLQAEKEVLEQQIDALRDIAKED